MKKFKKLAIATITALSLFSLNTHVSAHTNTYTVKSGDTLWSIANRYSVPLASLKNINDTRNNLIFVGEKLAIPNSITKSDRELMARLVYAEAKGESYAGKVAVATVVLNRVDHPEFPNTVRGVIYEQMGGSYAFSPVQNGAINQIADYASKKAVDEALAYRGQGKGSIYFYNPRTSTSKWIFSREVTVVIGNHRFAK